MVVTGTSPPTVQAQSLLSRLLGRKGTQGKSELPGRGATESESTGRRAGGEGKKVKGKDTSPLPKRRLHELRCPWGEFRWGQIFCF